ncbi:hypothetical protein E4U26_006908 [Claviceps purpurea]|nr:hypothetical protein E4U26_006908 [Claviceps purpurea]
MKIILAVTTPSHTKKSIASPTMSDMDVMQSYPDTEIEDGTGPIEELDAVAVREVNGRFELSMRAFICASAWQKNWYDWLFDWKSHDGWDPA